MIDIAALLKRSIENYYEILCCFGRQNLYYSSNQAMAAASFFWKLEILFDIFSDISEARAYLLLL